MKSTNHTHETQQDSAKITGAMDRFFQNRSLPFGKDSAYELHKGSCAEQIHQGVSAAVCLLVGRIELASP